MNRTLARTLTALALALAPGCEVEEIVDAGQMPISENGVYTDNGRFFVAGGDTIYEVTGGPDTFAAKPLLQDPSCYFGGLTDRGNVLYAPCDRNEAGLPPQLVRLDPTHPAAPQVTRTEFPAFAHPTLLNGSDFGPDGALYISNSLGTLLGDATIIRVRILSEAPLSIQVEPFLDAVTALQDLDQSGGLFPNGLRFLGNTLYFSRGPDVVKMALLANGARGPLEVVYRTGDLAVIDDFDIAQGYLVMAYTHSLGLIAPGFESKLVITDLNGKLVREIAMPVPPSSTAVRPNTLFGAKSIVVTSFFNGGLYRVLPK